MIQYYKIRMGNIEQKMAQAKSLDELSGTLKHLQETRSDSQIEITNRLTHLLSDVNTERIMSHKSISAKDLDWSQYIFVCIQGFPAVKNQFDCLELPGQTMYFSAISFSQEALMSDEKTQQAYVYQSTFGKEAKRLHQVLSKIQKNRIILVYHSAGNFILGMYFHLYGYGLAGKIKGLIDISGGPLRYYTAAQLLVPVVLQADFEEIMQNSDKVSRMFLKAVGSTGFDLGFKSKYQTLSFLHYTRSPQYGQTFESTWHHPNVLKLIIHGRNDTLFESKLLNEKAIYYCYRKELDKEYQDKLKEKYVTLYQPKQVPENIQQRFILAIPKGQHSIHSQPKNQPLIRHAVQQYLTLVHEPK